MFIYWEGWGPGTTGFLLALSSLVDQIISFQIAAESENDVFPLKLAMNSCSHREIPPGKAS